MSSYEELKKEFNEKVQKLRQECKHEEISNWMPYCWAPGHSTGFEVRVCKNCEAVITRRTHCWQCGKWVEEPNIIEGDGKEVPIGTYFCSEECIEKYKAKQKFPRFPFRPTE